MFSFIRNASFHYFLVVKRISNRRQDDHLSTQKVVWKLEPRSCGEKTRFTWNIFTKCCCKPERNTPNPTNVPRVSHLCKFAIWHVIYMRNPELFIIAIESRWHQEYSNLETRDFYFVNLWSARNCLALAFTRVQRLRDMSIWIVEVHLGTKGRGQPNFVHWCNVYEGNFEYVLNVLPLTTCCFFVYYKFRMCWQ